MAKSKRFVSLLFLIICALFVSGMSGLGGDDAPRRIPTPDENYAVTVLDQVDVLTKVTMFTIDGHSLFLGRKGKGRLAVPFGKIRRVDFRLKDGEFEALIQLKNGGKLSLTADRRYECFGRTKFGNFKITLGDIKTLTIDGPVSAPEK